MAHEPLLSQKRVKEASLSAKLADFQRVFFYTQLNIQKLGYHQAL